MCKCDKKDDCIINEEELENNDDSHLTDSCEQKQETEVEIEHKECKCSEKRKELEKEINQLKHLNKSLQKEVEEKQKKIDSLQEKLNELNANFVAKVQEKANQANEHLSREIKNFQEKQEKEMAEFKKYCVADKLNEIIDIIGRFDQAISFESQDPKINNFLMGFQMFKTQFKSALEALNINEIDVKVGDEFDHNTMEAIDQCTENPTQPNNHVEKVVDKGYKIFNRLIKPVRVIVAKK
ncbi:MAG: nucleotide exchange factor GrpE [Mycoplasmataceae bacterium]|nr:nucleotide exchange factor GrpE [Mycoplasmataceae bacterium]